MRLPVKFDQPPVVEVVIGVMFRELDQMRAPHLGVFWSKLREQFPVTEERPALDPLIELMDPQAPIRMEFLSTLPLPRIWLIAQDGRSLLQIQRDRFLYNWKRVDATDSYPTYGQVIAKFEEHWRQFCRFVRDESLGNIEFRQFELTYVNHIRRESGLDISGEYGLLVDHVRKNTPERFLPTPEGFDWRTVYRFPENAGRLHILARSLITPDRERFVQLDMTARGIPSDRTDIGRRAWFDLAHEWITHGFADATSHETQLLGWRRTQ